MDYNVINYGASGNGIDVDTSFIQNAIYDCHKSGGGRVIFPSNKVFRCGKIVLMDNVELHIEKESLLIASNKLEDFNTSIEEINRVQKPTWENCEYNGRPTQYFIYAKNVDNISITGEGSIDGNEEIFYGKVSKYHIDGFYYPRVPLIYFENCKHVKIKNLTLKRSAFWTIHLVGCQKVEIEKIKILNNLILANSDGIDPDHCQDVTIKDCYIEAADDCIVFKTTLGAKSYGACKNIEVSGCTLVSTSAAIKFGTESVSDFENIYIHDCAIKRSNRGISFQLRDEGNIHNIVFERISIETKMCSPVEWWGKAEPIAITAVKRKPDTNIGTISGISFRDMVMLSENGIFIFGEEIQNISNIKFENINLEIKDFTEWNKNLHDLRPSYEYGILETKRSYLYICNAKKLYFHNFKHIDSLAIEPYYGYNVEDLEIKE